MFKARIICPLLLLLLIAGHVANNAAWVAEEAAPARWDQAAYLDCSLKYYYHLTVRPASLPEILHEFRTLDRRHSQMMPLMAGVLCSLFGESRATAMWVNHIAVVVLCLSLYGIGRRLGRAWCGLVAAYVTMAMPAMFGLSRQFLLEFSVTAAVMLFVYCLVNREGRGSVFRVLLAGGAVTVGLLIRETFLMYIAVPTAVAFVYALKRAASGRAGDGKDAVRELCAIVIALVAGGAAAWLLWYGPNFSVWYESAAGNFLGEVGSHYWVPLPEYLAFQVRAAHLQYYVPLALLILVLWRLFVGRARRSRVKRKENVHLRADIITLAGGVLVPLGVCLVSVDRIAHFFFPALPMLGLLLAYFYVRFARGWVAVVVAAGLLYLVVPVGYISWYAPVQVEDADGVSSSWGRFSAGLLPLPSYAVPPEKEDWKTRDVIELINCDYLRRHKAGGIKGVCLPSLPHFHGNWFKYLGLQMHLRGETRCLCRMDTLPLPVGLAEDECADFISTQQYVVTKSGDNGVDWLTAQNERIVDAIKKAEGYLFEEISGGIELPDGSTVTVYRNRFLVAGPGSEEFTRARERFRVDFRRIR